MLKIRKKELDRLERDYLGIRQQILEFENADLPPCSQCGSQDTAAVHCGLIGRTMTIADATTKFKLVPNRGRRGQYFCNECEKFFNPDSSPSRPK